MGNHIERQETILLPVAKERGLDTEKEYASKEGRWKRMFSSLRHRNYRLFFFGQLVSLCGTWMQQVALPWYVYQLTGSKLMLGLVSASYSLPSLIFSFVGGAAADFYPKRYVLLFTQGSMMCLAFLFWGLIATNHISIPWIFALTLASGMIFSLDVPARQSFVIEMVGKKDLMNAIALNSSLFNTARIVGPSLGGVVISVFGVAHCFLFNGLSFIAIILALLLMDVPSRTPREVSSSFLESILEGLAFARIHPIIRTTLILIAISTIFAAPYFILLPVFAKDILHVGADGLGFMMAASGLGALAGALCLASLGDFRRRGTLLLSGMILFAAAVEAFSWSHWIQTSVACLVVAGSAMTLYGSTCNTLLQTVVPDDLRGRVMSLFTLGFIGLMPFGSLQAGFLAQYIGAPLTVSLGAAVTGVLAVIVLISVPKMRRV
jgi:MFS family permease